MRTTVVKSFRFEAAHRLDWHPGRCSRPHGHGYRIEVAISGPVDQNGVVVDFDDVSAAVRADVLERYDHADLNEILANPTAENIAADALARLRAGGLPVSWVRLWETDTGSALVEWTDTDPAGP